MRTLAIGFFVMLLMGVLPAHATDTVASPGREVTPLPPVTIYHLEACRSERIVWLMEELGFPYELKFVPGYGECASIRRIFTSHALTH